VSGWLIETGIAVTVLMLLVLALRRPVAHFFGAGWAYALWLLPALRIVLPPLHMFGDALPSLWRSAPAAPVTASAASAFTAAPAFDWQPVLLAVWMVGAALMVLWQVWSYLSFVRRLGIGSQVQASLAHEIGVIESPSVDGPLAIGLLDRWIVVPTDFTTRYTPQEQRLALEHERTHHRREDIFCNMLALGVLALNWFNPVAYFAFRAFRADQELSCDAAVAARASAAERHDYARALVKSASSPGLIAACPLNEAGQLKRRLKMMKAHRRGRLRAVAGSSAVAAIVLAGISVTESAGVAAPQPAPASPVAVAAPARAPSAAPIAPTVAAPAAKAIKPHERAKAPPPARKRLAAAPAPRVAPEPQAAQSEPRKVVFVRVTESVGGPDHVVLSGARPGEVREFRIIRRGAPLAAPAPHTLEELEAVRIRVEGDERLGPESKARLRAALQHAAERRRD
jgi:beta-lactamase regulating signal transducer with metallopeptidase domain